MRSGDFGELEFPAVRRFSGFRGPGVAAGPPPASLGRLGGCSEHCRSKLSPRSGSAGALLSVGKRSGIPLRLLLGTLLRPVVSEEEERPSAPARDDRLKRNAHLAAEVPG